MKQAPEHDKLSQPSSKLPENQLAKANHSQPLEVECYATKELSPGKATHEDLPKLP
jgi:hypothetical protein